MHKQDAAAEWRVNPLLTGVGPAAHRECCRAGCFQQEPSLKEKGTVESLMEGPQDRVPRFPWLQNSKHLLGELSGAAPRPEWDCSCCSSPYWFTKPNKHCPHLPKELLAVDYLREKDTWVFKNAAPGKSELYLAERYTFKGMRVALIGLDGFLKVFVREKGLDGGSGRNMMKTDYREFSKS